MPGNNVISSDIMNTRNDDLMPFLLRGSSNTGPTMKEFLLWQAQEEFTSDHLEDSIFYQVRSLFLAFEERACHIPVSSETENDGETNQQNKDTLEIMDKLLQNMSPWEKEDLKSNTLMQYLVDTLKQEEQPKKESCTNEQSSNFLQDITDPVVGLQKIIAVCNEFPKEWTVVQLCKGPRAETTYTTYADIHEMDAPIYVSVLRHARWQQYPSPVCVRLNSPDQRKIFKKFSSVTTRFKAIINVNPTTYNSKEAKLKYWESLTEFNEFLASLLAEMKNFIYPWRFLFNGISTTSSTAGAATATPSANQGNVIELQNAQAFAAVDAFCDGHGWAVRERILLSLAAMHAPFMSELEIHAVCRSLCSNERQRTKAGELLMEWRSKAVATNTTNFPCILVVDDRLDHFFWEEVNIFQEYTRVNSLMCLNRLFLVHKERISGGYLQVHITDGGSICNPDNNLPKSEMRMRSFFEHWIPHWRLKFTERPTQEELLNDFLKRPCFIYAGHGSGLQYLNGKHIARQRINSVVFLFGCDSSRSLSNGLYSEMMGTHLYYQAATCPTIVGTLMPALDANMDAVATEVLSRWIAPGRGYVLPWNEIDSSGWLKEGIVRPKCSRSALRTVATTPNYHVGSLCALIARVHQRLTEHRYYNTVIYVCRGLPAWNCDVQPLP